MDYWLYIIGQKFGKLPSEIEEEIDMREFFTIIHVMNALATTENPDVEKDTIS